jgi:malate dehydrogenase
MFSKLSSFSHTLIRPSLRRFSTLKKSPSSMMRPLLAFTSISLVSYYSYKSFNTQAQPSGKQEENKPTKVLKVCITGAAGQIGYAFIPLLLTGQVFGPDVRIDLRLLDIPPAEGVLKGVVMEIMDGAYPLLEKVTSGSDPKVLFKDIDVGVFIGGFPRKPGMERKDLLQTNGKIFKAQGEALNEVANPNVKCVVVANPANTNCLLLSNYAANIDKRNFSALTRLDHNRAIAQIAEKAGVHNTNVQNVIIWGNHSTTQYPDVNHGTVNGKSIREVVNDNEYLNKSFVERVQKRGG